MCHMSCAIYYDDAKPAKLISKGTKLGVCVH